MKLQLYSQGTSRCNVSRSVGKSGPTPGLAKCTNAPRHCANQAVRGTHAPGQGSHMRPQVFRTRGPCFHTQVRRQPAKSPLALDYAEHNKDKLNTILLDRCKQGGCSAQLQTMCRGVSAASVTPPPAPKLMKQLETRTTLNKTCRCHSHASPWRSKLGATSRERSHNRELNTHLLANRAPAFIRRPTEGPL